MTEEAPGTQDHSIPLSVPHLNGDELENLTECIETNWVSSAGDFVDEFGERVAEATDRSYGIPVSTGTAALHLSLRVIGVRPGDEVLVNTLTFIAPANAVRYLGAHPVFIDAEPDYYQMDPKALRRFLDEQCRWEGDELVNTETGRTVRALLPVHVLGHPCDMDAILDLAEEYDLPIVEDACESLGARYKGDPVGSHGDIACLSFNGNKIVTAGGGGVLVTDDEDLANKARYLSTQAKDDPVEYIHNEVGFNYRVTNLQAAVAVAQMEHLQDHVRSKRKTAATYRDELADIQGIEPMKQARWATSTYWLYTVRIDPERYGRSRRALQDDLRQRGIQVRPLWQPLHRSPAHPDAVIGGDVAEAAKRHCLSLPCSVSLSQKDQNKVIEALK